jgi:hypothetical protein
VKILQGVQKSKESFEDSIGEEKLRKGSGSYTQRDSSSRSSQREQVKVEAFGKFEFLPRLGRRRAQEEQQEPSDQAERRDLDRRAVHVQQRSARGSAQERRTDSRRISRKNPVSRRIGKSCAELSLWRRCAQGERI